MESTKKSGLSPIAMVGIGCGAVTIIGIIAAVGLVWFGVGKVKDIADDFANNPAAAAEAIVKLNPELDHVATDSEAGTITVRNKQSGETVTLNFDDIKQGNFSVQGADGEDVFSIDTNNDGTNGVTINAGDGGQMQIGGAVDTSDVPTWVHIYPNTTKASTALSRKSPDGKPSGTLVFEVADEVPTISDHYRAELENKGFSVDEQAIESNGIKKQSILTATHAENGQSLNIIIGENNGKRTLMINYEEK